MPAMSNAPLFLHLAGSLAFVAVAGRGIGWALDAWVRRAPDGPEGDVAPAAHPEPPRPPAPFPERAARDRASA
ncbi:hypothetical protein [Methylobacterium nonmethylotrophicum]|uniref:Uncharacterized protein n=1 Tax=Methylobacterium nonmethylotrophicum TaxID=1141884 RepID=A0A4Z0NJN4_9HYPH|nr:hypothetical protein [Methylobacterium nonmethylotrophicum]TGD96054.1 hypothetical protein EU555_25165 [Methylobacterium nonmethylotrophicum]